MIKLTVVTPEKLLLKSEETKEVLLPGEKGEIGVLPGHAPLVSALGKGSLKHHSPKGEWKEITVNQGYLEVRGDEVIVLAEFADPVK